MLLSVLFPFVLIVIVASLKFDNITNDIFPVNFGVIAAFGHLNSDEFTDIFSLQQGGKKLQVFLGSETEQQFQQHVNCTFASVITSVVPGDFNGDSQMDLLITLMTSSDSSALDVKILWGNDSRVDCKSPTVFTVINQPLIVDFNGDMIPDVIAETKSGDRNVWIASYEKKFSNKTFINSYQKFRNPHSSGLIDMNDDLAADILIFGEEDIEVGLNIGKEYNFSKENSIRYPNNISGHSRLQSTFVDFNSDGSLDVIMPVCYDSKCDHSAILILNKSSSMWEVLLDNFKHENATWGFKLPYGSPLDIAALPATLRPGDIDMDGYPDFLAILELKSANSKSKPVIIKNSPCLNSTHCINGRYLEIVWDVPGLKDIPNIEIAAFFDIYENGILDILASSKDYDHEWKIHALINAGNHDSCFMKVLVLSGLCRNCSVGHLPSGVNQPGPIVMYNMTKQDGHPLVSSAVQMPQTAYFPLHLPYSLFGLGQTPNFIDALTVAIPGKFINRTHKREWTQIIPNSQIVVIPYPPIDESRWVKRLFVTPSHYVLLTCIALVGTCTFIAIIVALLHWKERKEDKKEKMQDAYRFHFDAM